MQPIGAVVRNRTLLAGLVITALVLFGVTAGAALSPSLPDQHGLC